MVNAALFSSNSDEWATPNKIFDDLNHEFNFDLDVCANESNHKTAEYFTKETDGLMQNWGGVVSFVIRHIQILPNGLKRLITKVLNRTH